MDNKYRLEDDAVSKADPKLPNYYVSDDGVLMIELQPGRFISETAARSGLVHSKVIVLQEIWREVPDLKPLRVGIALSSLAPEQAHQPDLFDKPCDARLVTAIDELNAKFGKGAITYGTAAAGQTSKIAFQRVPKVKEF